MGFGTNVTLKIVFPAITYLPYIRVTGDGDKFTNYTGLLPELLDKLASHMKFKYIVMQPVDESYGVLVNGSWNGLVGMVQRKEVDMVVSAMTITYARKNVVDFSSPYSSESLGILIRMAGKEISMWNMIFVFKPTVWLTILTCVISAVFIIRMIDYLDNKITANETKCGISYCIWLVYGGLLNQICNISTKSWSNRIFQLCWRICAVLLISVYAGCLVAALALEQVLLPFTDLKGLTEAVKRNEYKICLPNTTAFFTAVMSAQSPEYTTLKNWVEKNPDFAVPLSECVAKLRTMDNIAIPEEVTYLQDIQMDYCNEFPTVLLEDRFYPGYFALAFPKGSQLNLKVSKSITEIVEDGLVEKWKFKYKRDPVFCEIPSVSGKVTAQVKQLILKYFGGPFILYTFGCVFAISAFALEILCKREHLYKY